MVLTILIFIRFFTGLSGLAAKLGSASHTGRPSPDLASAESGPAGAALLAENMARENNGARRDASHADGFSRFGFFRRRGLIICFLDHSAGGGCWQAGAISGCF